ncbi:hypothetical protein OQA88_9962 [Cercophora sp. LCS_1]
MTSRSSFLPRISLQRDNNPLLPMHNQPSSVRKKVSEYDLSELSPRPEEGTLSPPSSISRKISLDRRSPSPAAAFSDRTSNAGSASKSKPRALFAGPPPPIAASRMFYRDEEESPPTRGLDASTIARNINSVLFDRASPSRARDTVQEYEPDTVWRNLQRREKTLQKELQLLLDAQSAGLAAHLDPTAAAPSDISDAGSNTPTGTLYTSASSRRSHVAFEEPVRSSVTGEIIPVRQPRKKPLGLRAARAGLARNITLLADLKAEEDANLTAALGARKKALTQLRTLADRRDGIAGELQALEGEEEEPLARELRELGEDCEGVTAEIAELEERLVGLRNRKRWLRGRIEDVKNRREAGLSGYKGALREVEARVEGILRRPGVKPLDLEAIVGVRGGADEDGVEQSPGGTEFLKLRPERRTVEMARDWWEGEVAILERRKKEVDKERAALEEGVEVWKSAASLVADFEADLRREMKTNGEGQPDGKGKSAVVSPEQTMYAQLGKMATVMAGLEERLRVAEERGWNLLICAIGAELAAFREAEHMLREALRSAGLDVDGDAASETHDEQDDDQENERTPQLGRSMSNMRSSVLGNSVWRSEAANNTVNSGLLRMDGFKSNGTLLDLHDEDDANEVPPDLLTSHVDDHGGSAFSRDDSLSSNEVPPEFLAEHRHDDDEHELR